MSEAKSLEIKDGRLVGGWPERVKLSKAFALTSSCCVRRRDTISINFANGCATYSVPVNYTDIDHFEGTRIQHMLW